MFDKSEIKNRKWFIIFFAPCSKKEEQTYMLLSNHDLKRIQMLLSQKYLQHIFHNPKS